MIKALGIGKDGEPIVLLGISKENVKRLQEGKPILAKTPVATISIFYGETEQDMLDDLIKAGVEYEGKTP